jgi:hypothetical protein
MEEKKYTEEEFRPTLYTEINVLKTWHGFYSDQIEYLKQECANIEAQLQRLEETKQSLEMGMPAKRSKLGGDNRIDALRIIEEVEQKAEQSAGQPRPRIVQKKKRSILDMQTDQMQTEQIDKATSAHRHIEKITGQPNIMGKYKYYQCPYWNTINGCPYGGYCYYRHDGVGKDSINSRVPCASVHCHNDPNCRDMTKCTFSHNRVIGFLPPVTH